MASVSPLDRLRSLIPVDRLLRFGSGTRPGVGAPAPVHQGQVEAESRGRLIYSVIEYRVRQTTSAPPHKIDGVAAKLKFELELQFGKTIDVEVLGIYGAYAGEESYVRS